MAAPNQAFDNLSQPKSGGLLEELERRQDDVLNQLDDLDSKLNQVLESLDQSSPNASADTAISETQSAEYWA